MIRRNAKVAALLAAVLMVGCASAEEDAARDVVTVEVHNNFAGASPQEISIVGEGMSPRVLGTVEAGSTARFEATGLDFADPHRLVASTPTGALIRSQALTLENGALVVWDLSTNRVHIET